MKNFEKRILNLQRPKGAKPKTLTFQQFLDEKGKNYYNKRDINILKKLAEDNNEVIESCYDFFKMNKDEEEFIDTLSRILKKNIKENEPDNNHLSISLTKKKELKSSNNHSSSYNSSNFANQSFEYFVESEDEISKKNSKRSRSNKNSRGTPKKLKSEIIDPNKDRDIFLKKDEPNNQEINPINESNNQGYIEALYNEKKNLATPNFLKPNKFNSSSPQISIEEKASVRSNFSDEERDFYAKMMKFCFDQFNVPWKITSILQNLILKEIDLKVKL